MKKNINLAIIFLCFLLSSCQTIKQVEIAGDHIIDNAALQGNYILEKGYAEAELALFNANNMLESQQNNLFNNLSSIREQLSNDIDQMFTRIESTSNQIMSIEDFASLDITNFVNKIPFIEKTFSIRGIKGYSQIYKEQGEYTVTILGNAFSVETPVDVTINGYKLPSYNTRQSRQYEIKIVFPVSLINGLFEDNSSNRANIKVEAHIKRQKKPFTYNGKLILLPKNLVKYRFIETVSEQTGWSDPIVIQNSITLPSSGRSGNYTADTPISVSIPLVDAETSRIIIDSLNCYAAYADGAWMRKSGPKYSGINNSTATWIVSNQIHDKSRVFIASLAYQRQINGLVDRVNYFTKNEQIVKDYMSNGTYLKTMSKNYKTYRIEIELFNGDKYTLTPTKQNSPGIAVSLENRSDFTRLRVDIDFERMF